MRACVCVSVRVYAFDFYRATRLRDIFVIAERYWSIRRRHVRHPGRSRVRPKVHRDPPDLTPTGYSLAIQFADWWNSPGQRSSLFSNVDPKSSAGLRSTEFRSHFLLNVSQSGIDSYRLRRTFTDKELNRPINKVLGKGTRQTWLYLSLDKRTVWRHESILSSLQSKQWTDIFNRLFSTWRLINMMAIWSC